MRIGFDGVRLDLDEPLGHQEVRVLMDIRPRDIGEEGKNEQAEIKHEQDQGLKGIKESICGLFMGTLRYPLNHTYGDH